ncbi:MAG TPA: FdhF/YdeP family oxidoreductase [Kineosporiaceae bacterium]|nr:FdhF/YdeP family oxidoreductase [Kineosporiaceae bacterium]
MSKAPIDDFDEQGLEVGHRKEWAAGVPGVRWAMQVALDQMGPSRTARTLLKLNQQDGFDCPGCAWPEKEHRHKAEFCENGAKAVAEEATKRRVEREFFAQHSVTDLASKSDWWLGQQGRLIEPMLKPAGQDHYRPIGWDQAFDLIATELRSLESPDQATFYTSGRTSNEAAFLYQLMVRGFGTNNLPDCSNMCHESSGSALVQAIGVGKGSVTLEDLEAADLIIVMGQNPGTNHPRMLSTLETAKQNGAVIVAVNPLPEAGMINFRNPQTPKGMVGNGTPLADDFLQARLGGDLALLLAAGKLLIEADDAAPGTVVDRAFVEQYTSGFEAYAEHVRKLDLGDLVAGTGLSETEVRSLANRLLVSKKTIICWAMGITQHKHSVATIREIVNVLLIQGNLGRPGAGVCPVRGHSNVQGDRTMGIFERMPDWFLDNLGAEFGFQPPREPGHDTVESIRAMRDGKVKVFMAVGGNFVRATPDSNLTEAALRSCRLTVQVSTKLNRSHAVCGETALILPTLGRTDRDRQRTGEQLVSVEDSMSRVHRSKGTVEPPSKNLLSEVSIVCQLAERLIGDGVAAPWVEFEADYRTIRERISRVIPGFADFEAKLAQPAGFALPHASRSREFPTSTGRANFAVNELWYPQVLPGRLLLQTIRSHDQYNTTIYGLDDRYRGIKGGRRVVFVNPADLTELGLADGAMVDLVGEFADGVERRAENFRVVSYNTAKGCAAAYYPETNVLVPLDSVADVSNTPTSKSVVVRLEPATS